MLRRLIVVLPAALGTFLVLTATSALAGGCQSWGVTEGSGTTVDMRSCGFFPTVLHVQPGERVSFVNRDGIAHLVTGASGSWGTYSPVSAGQSVAYEFTKPGLYPYTCMLHGGMTGAVVVGDGAASGGGAVGAVVPATLMQARASATPAPRGAGSAKTTGPWPVLATALALLGGLVGYALAAFRRSGRAA